MHARGRQSSAGSRTSSFYQLLAAICIEERSRSGLAPIIGSHPQCNLLEIISVDLVQDQKPPMVETACAVTCAHAHEILSLDLHAAHGSGCAESANSVPSSDSAASCEQDSHIFSCAWRRRTSLLLSPHAGPAADICLTTMAAAVASPLVNAVAPAKSADFDHLRYQEKIKEYVVKVCGLAACALRAAKRDLCGHKP